MFRRIMCLGLVTLAALIARPAVAGIVIYEEDFEGGANGQSVLDPPFNWASGYASSTIDVTNANTAMTNLHLDGSTGSGGVAGGIVTVKTPVAGPSPGAL